MVIINFLILYNTTLKKYYPSLILLSRSAITILSLLGMAKLTRPLDRPDPQQGLGGPCPNPRTGQGRPGYGHLTRHPARQML